MIVAVASKESHTVLEWDVHSLDTIKVIREAERIASTVIAILNSKEPGSGTVSFRNLYYKEDMRCKFILNGDLTIIAKLLEIIDGLRDD